MECLNTTQPDTQGLDPNGWAVLACNELPMPMSSDSKTSMFPPEEWSNAEYSDECLEQFLQQPQYDWVFNYYGGVMTKINDEVVSLYIGDSAHHLDLRLPHPQDP